MKLFTRLQCSARIAALWPGRTPSIPAAMVNTVIKKTTQTNLTS
jgi:hypothetical protein